ncbi:NlpC/P60 family protein [Paenibacillus sp. T2-29]|uniref:NlpC/P60 family protein n=1 Tax=Paenibacillus TaxID=44249 RepID=UPI0039BD7415
MTSTYDYSVCQVIKKNNELMSEILRDEYGTNLNIESVWNEWEAIEKHEIRRGDVMFFGFDFPCELYVGISQSNEKFIHFTKYGMTESSLKNDGWGYRLIGTRRATQSK